MEQKHLTSWSGCERERGGDQRPALPFEDTLPRDLQTSSEAPHQDGSASPKTATFWIVLAHSPLGHSSASHRSPICNFLTDHQKNQ